MTTSPLVRTTPCGETRGDTDGSAQEDGPQEERAQEEDYPEDGSGSARGGASGGSEALHAPGAGRLTRLEKQVETAQRDARRRWTRLLRDASHELGRLEAQGERAWRKRTAKARRDAVKALQRMEKAIKAKPGKTDHAQEDGPQEDAGAQGDRLTAVPLRGTVA